jgi:inosose dehydratase
MHAGPRHEEGTLVPIADRLAGAPISWGVCEVPGWGATLPPVRVLREMRELGLRATELGPVGYLGREASEVRGLLESFDLEAVGGFVPLVLTAGSRQLSRRGPYS